MKKTWIFVCILFVGIAAVLLSLRPLRSAPAISWKRVLMDGSRTGVKTVTAEGLEASLGRFDGDRYTAPSGAVFSEGPVVEAAALLLEAQPALSPLKVVVGHSSRMLMNRRDEPDLPLANLFADALRARGTAYWKVPMDFAVTNYGGIRVPLPEGAVTLEDIESMFPFGNVMVYAKVKGKNLLRLLQQLAATKAFQAVSGCRVAVKDHQLVRAEVGGAPIDPERIYHVTTIDFLLDGGDQIAIGALAEEVLLSRILLKDVMLDYVRDCEAKGVVLEGKKDGRIIME